jgi:hypothetical protein
MAGKKWYLISSLDDHSRKILYADLWSSESSWAHIVAAKSLFSNVGCPLRYYVDNHSIFRYVKKRDSVWRKFNLDEEDAFVQWKEVLSDLKVKITYALSPQAKGKVERSYRWIQDHLVRTCSREGITKIEDARSILYQEIHDYNYKRVHGTTGQTPQKRFEKALEEKRSVFKKLIAPSPYEIKDMFSLRVKRQVDAYRRVSVNNLKFSLSGVPIREKVEMRISLKPKDQLANIRFWYRQKLIDEKEVKIQDLKLNNLWSGFNS